MFSRFISFCLFLSQADPAYAEKPSLIDARQTSGFTRMEDAFEHICTLQSTGQLNGILRKGMTNSGRWSTEKRFQLIVPSNDLQKILSLLQDSKAGPFQKEPAVCDTGDLIIRGNTESIPIPIIELRDCRPGILNLNPSAKKIENWVRSLCRWSS